MDNVVKAAVSAGPEWLYVVSTILVVLVGVLGVITWWLLKKRATETSKRLENLEVQNKIFLEKMSVVTERLDSRNRADEVLEKRLASGATKFEKIDAEHEKYLSGINDKFEQVNYQIKALSDSVNKTQGFFLDFSQKYVRNEQFIQHCDDDKEQRRDLRKEMVVLTERWEESNRETIGLLKKMEGRLDAMSEILTRREPPVGREE
jgi:hypothetical protein